MAVSTNAMNPTLIFHWISPNLVKKTFPEQKDESDDKGDQTHELRPRPLSYNPALYPLFKSDAMRESDACRTTAVSMKKPIRGILSLVVSPDFFLFQ